MESGAFPQCPFCGTQMASGSIRDQKNMFMIPEVAPETDPDEDPSSGKRQWVETGKGWIVQLFICPKCGMMAFKNKVE